MVKESARCTLQFVADKLNVRPAQLRPTLRRLGIVDEHDTMPAAIGWALLLGNVPGGPDAPGMLELYRKAKI